MRAGVGSVGPGKDLWGRNTDYRAETGSVGRNTDYRGRIKSVEPGEGLWGREISPGDVKRHQSQHDEDERSANPDLSTQRYPMRAALSFRPCSRQT